MSDEIVILNTKCPVCGEKATLKYKPFCSKKCANIDLNRWFKGSYVVHTDEVPTSDEAFDTVETPS